MTLNASGPISLAGAVTGQSIAVELNLSPTSQISLNENSVRTLAGVPSGVITMPTNFYGKSNEYAFTIASNQLNADLRTLAIAAGWNQTTKLIATINASVYVYSNSTATPALTVSGSFPNGVTLINNGYIVGMGGSGGYGAGAVSPSGENGLNGGTGLSVSSATTINNASGVIAGGGGGGGGGGSFQEGDPPYGWAGGGGGGGQSGLTNSAAGAAGTGTIYQRSRDSAAGTAGTVSAAGSGGIGAAAPFGQEAGPGGGGGSWGVNGATGGLANPSFPTQPPGSGGTAGAAVSGNSFITWTNIGTRYGSVS